ncbi:hypothetical protein R1flu_004351 [Riccia fluitans]|uniref:BTB domain-containing protein n=1 Tax=Riccia fluitans TaxID=41844 RepID=A0ABD1YU20_9MARC
MRAIIKFSGQFIDCLSFDQRASPTRVYTIDSFCHKIMHCPHCGELLYCSCCDSHFINSGDQWYQDRSFEAPGCTICKRRYQNQGHEVEQLKLVIQKLRARLDFLKLEDPDLSTEVFQGDATFVVQSGEIRVHRFVLADKSTVFRKMLESGMIDGETGIINIDDASYPEMQAVVRYCYTADIEFTEDVRPEEVLKIAHKYEIFSLKDRCAEELCGTISKANLIEMMRLSRDYEAAQLQEALGAFLKEQFEEVYPIILEAV